MAILDKNFSAVTTNPLRSRFLYEERKKYANSVEGYYNLVNQNHIDLWYDVPFYGKVDTAGRLVCPKVDLMDYSIGRNNLITFDFLQDALNDYFFFLNKMAAQNRTRLDRLFNDFAIKTAFYDSQLGVKNQVIKNFKGYNRLITGDNIPIFTFDQYICNLNETFAESEKHITFFSIFASNSVPVDASGLAFRFSFEDEDDDSLKNKYFKNEEYHKFVNISANFGFRVNKNAPWMVIADLNSQPMIGKVGRKVKRYRRNNRSGEKRVETIIPGYLQNRLVPNLDFFFEKYYNKVIYESFNMYKELIIQSYKNYFEDYDYLYDHGTVIVGEPPPDYLYDHGNVTAGENKRFTSISGIGFNRTKGRMIPIKPFEEEKYDDYFFIKKFEYMLKHEMKKVYNKKTYKFFKNKFDYMVNIKKSIKDILDYMEEYYTPTKIYNPENNKLNWKKSGNMLTKTKSYASLQNKSQPNINKIVTEYTPDI